MRGKGERGRSASARSCARPCLSAAKRTSARRIGGPGGTGRASSSWLLLPPAAHSKGKQTAGSSGSPSCSPAESSPISPSRMSLILALPLHSSSERSGFALRSVPPSRPRNWGSLSRFRARLCRCQAPHRDGARAGPLPRASLCAGDRLHREPRAARQGQGAAHLAGSQLSAICSKPSDRIACASRFPPRATSSTRRGLSSRSWRRFSRRPSRSSPAGSTSPAKPGSRGSAGPAMPRARSISWKTRVSPRGTSRPGPRSIACAEPSMRASAPYSLARRERSPWRSSPESRAASPRR